MTGEDIAIANEDLSSAECRQPRFDREAAYSWLGPVCSIIYGLLFLWTGLSKLQQPYDFLAAVYDYELVGPSLGLWIARVLPYLEIAIGVCLLGGMWRFGAWAIAIALFIVFTAVKLSALTRGLAISCACVSGITELITWTDVAWSVLLLLGSGAGLVFTWKGQGTISAPNVG